MSKNKHFIPFAKLSKRAQRKISLKSRKIWQINPVSRRTKKKVDQKVDFSYYNSLHGTGQRARRTYPSV